jgi:hypothetical protein
MSNLQHPQFTGATPTRFELGAPEQPTALGGAPASRGGESYARSVGVGLVGLGLWVFLITELASKLSPPSILSAGAPPPGYGSRPCPHRRVLSWTRSMAQ